MATILTKKSDTASSVPLAADLTNAAGGAELAVNTADKRLYSKTSGGTIVELGTNPSALSLPNGTANGIPYLNGSKVLTSGSALTFDGTSFGNTGPINGTQFNVSGASSATNGMWGAAGAALAWNLSSTELMRLTSTGLGIGTGSPSAKLDVFGTSAGFPSARFALNAGGGSVANLSGFQVYYNLSGGFAETTAVYGNSTNSYLAFGRHNGTSYSEVMRLDNSGNVGIGTSSPSQRLAVINNTTYQARAATATGNYTSGGMVFGGFGADASDPNYYGAVGYDHSTGKTYLRNRYFTATGGIAFQISTSSGFSDAALIDSSGNLGLGVTPSAWSGFKAFDIGATGSVACLSTQQQIGMNYYWNGSNYIYKTTNAASYYNQNSGSHAWYTAPSGTAGNAISFTQAMTLDASGNLLVGTTDSSTNQQGYAWNINSGGSFGRIGHANGTGSGTAYLAFQYNGGVIGTITQSGTTGVLYNLTSDYRLKNNPVTLTGSGAFIDALQPKTWDWWDGSGKGVGFIAHEFMEVAKYSGNGTKDAVDAEGKPVYQSIQPSSSEVMANLVAELQSIRKRLAALESK